MAGAAVIPALVNWDLLYQKPTMPRSNGMPYCLPSTWYMPMAPGLISLAHDDTSAEMSLTRPAFCCSRSPPPPHDWNRSGGVPAWRSVVSLVLNASFSRTVMLTLTFGWAAVYSSASVCHRLLPGSLFWM